MHNCLLAPSLVEIELGISGTSELYSEFSAFEFVSTVVLLAKWT